MTQQWYSVEQVAALLDLHVKTVRGYIRDERLPAVRVGKQYRIGREALARFTGTEPEPTARQRRVEVSTVVRIDGIDRSGMDRLSTMITGSQHGASEGAPLHVQTSYDETHESLRVVVLGEPGRTAELLNLIQAIAEQV